MEKKKKWKVSIVVSLIVGVLAIGGVATYLVAKDLSTFENGEKVKDENAMMLGTYITSKDQNGNEFNNRFHIKIVSGGSIKERIDITTTAKSSDKYVIKEIATLPNMVFVDITETLKKYTNNLGYYFWYKTNPSKNYVSCSIENLGNNFVSTEKVIYDSGYYAIQVPTKDGENVEMVGATIYQRNVLGWSL